MQVFLKGLWLLKAINLQAFKIHRGIFEISKGISDLWIASRVAFLAL